MARPKENALKPTERKTLSHKLHPITKVLHNQIPLKDISDVLAELDLILLQEDNTEWSGLICGREGYTVFTLGRKSSKDDRGMYTPVKDGLYFYWYKFCITGRYEINMYMV